MIAEVFRGNVMDVDRVEKDVVSVRSNRGEVVVGNLCAESVPYGLLDFVRRGLFRHSPCVVRGLSAKSLAARGVKLESE